MTWQVLAVGLFGIVLTLKVAAVVLRASVGIIRDAWRG